VVLALLAAHRILHISRIKVNVSDRVLLQVIYPYCKKHLNNRIQQAVSDKWSFDQFPEDVIWPFVPGRRFDRLRQEMFGRLQREEEALAAYSAATKQAAQVLRLSLSETEIVANIVDGLNKTQRSRLIFKNPPATFQELDQLCVCMIKMCPLMIMLGWVRTCNATT
jgi:hypothetical protein